MIGDSFIEHQYIEFDNVLSYRTKVHADRLTALLEYIIHNADALGLEVTGNIIFTISDSYELANKHIFSIEINAPVNKAFSSSQRYIYKPKFRLVNAVSIRVGSSSGSLIEAKETLMYFLTSKQLKAISGVYFSAIFNEYSQNIESYDLFVSISENIV